jgi:TetR/AcrR family transcriptional repressor of nem operon
LVKTTFATGLENLLATLGSQFGEPEEGDQGGDARARRIEVLAQVIGAIVLSRACPDDSSLADEILDVCRAAVLSRLSSDA